MFDYWGKNVKKNTIRRVGFMGLGKLGFPCALACASKGHAVRGYDPNPAIAETLESKKLPYKEVHADELLEKHGANIYAGHTEHYLDIMIEQCDVIFVPIQTPHDPKYEGVTRIPDERVDFDYSYLILAKKSILSDKVLSKSLMILDEIALESHKTKGFCDILRNLGLESSKVTFLISENNQNAYRSSKNIHNVRVLSSLNISLEVLNA